MATRVRFGNVEREPSLVDKVAQELTEAIISGDLPSGERLPPERDLGEQFGVSRTVIREAVRTLAARGLVRVTSGRGVEVAAFDANTVADSLRLFIRGSQVFDYEQIHEVRSTIEVKTAVLAAQRATQENIAGMEELCAEHEQRLRAGEYLAASHVDFEFHRALASAANNDLFLIMLDSIADVLREVRDKAYPQPHVGELGLTEHRQILQAVAAADADAAREAMVRHLEQAESIWAETEKSETEKSETDKSGPKERASTNGR